MYFIYDLAVHLSALGLKILALFRPKIQRFVTGRKDLWAALDAFLEPGRPRIWMHTASLGEFEQGLPVLEQLGETFPEHQLLVTFFSPSGYEVKKGRLPGVGVFYLPLDTRCNARRFVQAVSPEIALFVKYEVWPNFFRALEKNGTPILMFSALFRPGQAYFQPYGGFLRRTLKKATRIYVQDPASLALLEGIDYGNGALAGDTRLDRVAAIAAAGEPLEFMERFKGQRTCLVAGSTWPEDEAAIVPFLRENLPKEVCVVIAPHQVDEASVTALCNRLGPGTLRYSQFREAEADRATFLVADTIGLLTRIYRYADLAYVGGGFRTGLHNTLEPAVFGIPVMIGPHYDRFREARDLVAAGGILSVNGPAAFAKQASRLLADPDTRERIGQINTSYVEKNRGASVQILNGIRKLL
ncbi:glycosyltransferase N-terminal domain-containing protein [Robiginitalea sp. M366]|uniref:3-deoxy-D-manno-octulosonic acid transferase n=1 Tax=Robiginitalea aestuariiviva TaxID=3036903 RepID=UPI00240E3B87|nr:glycosyltransferase N-terminal domain-containing protein [Robiginitalea aestuariiviva]MDG1571074.1 glycosyltransferase N-terminal domain-containing protein [Robiginitalea aestuariiviva]